METPVEAGEPLEEQTTPSTQPWVTEPIATLQSQGPFLERHPKALILTLVSGVIGFSILVGGSFVALLVQALFFAEGPQYLNWGLWVLFVVVMAFLQFWVPYLAHHRYRYRINDQGLEIHRGVWWRSQIHVPRSRIQHTDVSQGPLERLLGLAHLVVHTAGTHNASTALTGIAYADALAAREELTEISTGADGV